MVRCIEEDKMVYKFFKRLFDIIFGLIGLVFLIPLTVILKIAYMCTGDFHSIFFVQPRIGKNGKIFRLVKYRSMMPNAEKELEELMKKDSKIKEEYQRNKKLVEDPRITKMGKFVRRFSIDELPQSINVFLGQMSLVGNRPYLTSEKREMGKYYDSIVKTKPGLTGYWQVSGRSSVSFKKRLEIEQRYSNIAGFKIDIKIFFKTFKVVLFGKDAK